MIWKFRWLVCSRLQQLWEFFDFHFQWNKIFSWHIVKTDLRFMQNAKYSFYTPYEIWIHWALKYPIQQIIGYFESMPITETTSQHHLLIKPATGCRLPRGPCFRIPRLEDFNFILSSFFCSFIVMIQQVGNIKSTCIHPYQK